MDLKDLEDIIITNLKDKTDEIKESFMVVEFFMRIIVI